MNFVPIFMLIVGIFGLLSTFIIGVRKTFAVVATVVGAVLAIGGFIYGYLYDYRIKCVFAFCFRYF